MIVLNRELHPIFNIDPDYVLTYKKECDVHLGAMKHQLSKQLIDYKVYYHLQKVYNDFYKIIKGLLEETYEDIKTWNEDKKNLELDLKTFVSSMKGPVPQKVQDRVLNHVDMFQTEMNKFYNVLQTICYNDAEGKN